MHEASSILATPQSRMCKRKLKLTIKKLRDLNTGQGPRTPSHGLSRKICPQSSFQGYLDQTKNPVIELKKKNNRDKGMFIHAKFWKNP